MSDAVGDLADDGTDVDDFAAATTPRRWRWPIRDWLPNDHIAEACLLLDVPEGMPPGEQAARVQRSIAHSWLAQAKRLEDGR